MAPVMGKIRKSLAREDAEHGTLIDGPQLPIKILVDDFDQVIVKAEAHGTVPRYFTYTLYPYPPSHHLG